MIFPPGSFYAELDQQYHLSQGDIIADVPLGRIPDPLHVCRPFKEPKGDRLGDSRYGAPELFKSPPAFQNKPEFVHAKGTVGLAMVIWQDCQLGKRTLQANTRGSQHFAGVAPIRPISDFPNVQVANKPPGFLEHENIREGNRPPLFYLPEFPLVQVPEGCLDLRLVWPVQQSLLVKRLTTLSVQARRLLYDHLYWFFTATERVVPALCPNCDAQLPSAVELPFASNDEVIDSDAT